MRSKVGIRTVRIALMNDAEQPLIMRVSVIDIKLTAAPPTKEANADACSC